MQRRLVITLVLFAFLAGCAPSRPTPESPVYWPTGGWRNTTPEEQGMDSEALARMFEHIREKELDLRSLLIVRNGYLVSELYPHPYSADQPHWVFSVTKSVIGTLIGIAIEKGYIQDVRQPLVSLLPEQDVAGLDEAKQAITLEDMLTQSSGLDCADDPVTGQPAAPAGQTWVQAALTQPLSSPPGSKFEYCTTTTHLLSAVLQKATGMTARQFANQVLFQPLGIGPISEERWPPDPQGLTLSGYGLALTPGEMAKLGYLFLNRGQWDGQSVVPADWVATSTTSHAATGDTKDYGYLWWVDPQGKWYAALGLGGQHVFIYPAQNLVVAFTSDLMTNPEGDLAPLQELLNEYILPAVKAGEPLSPNPQGQAQLKSMIEAVAHPQPAEPAPLPDIAREISGETFAFEDNPFGWQTMSFVFQEGAGEATVTVDGGRAVSVGMDGLYRVDTSDDATFPAASRGHWESPDTLVVENITVGQTGQVTLRIRFTGDSVHMTAQDRNSGSTQETQGTLSPAGP